MSEQRATDQVGEDGDPSGFATTPDPQRQIVPHVSIPDPAVRAALQAARKRIADPERWCCGAEALGHEPSAKADGLRLEGTANRVPTR